MSIGNEPTQPTEAVMRSAERLCFLDNLRTFLIFLVVLFHCGIVYESSGMTASFWIVDDPSTSNLPGLLNLIMDIFVMPTIFFISGFFAPQSLDRKGPWRFARSKFRRLVVPWLIAVTTMIPLYKMIFLISRGLPQERWTTYFHFSNGIFGMNWLWFLPVLFLFNLAFLGLSRLCPSIERISLVPAVAAMFTIGFISSVAASVFDWIGWTKTPFIDFQNERLLPYFLVFILGSVCFRRGVFDTDKRNMKLFIAVNATAWIPINLYVITLLNFLFKPGEYLISEGADLLLLWFGFHVSMLMLLYCAVTAFKYFVNRQGPLGATLSRLSYGVYIIHIAVMGPIALLLLGIDVPGLVKYPILTAATYVVSNLIVFAYTRAVEPKGLVSRTE